jgi:hypothetical protein
MKLAVPWIVSVFKMPFNSKSQPALGEDKRGKKMMLQKGVAG